MPFAIYALAAIQLILAVFGAFDRTYQMTGAICLAGGAAALALARIVQHMDAIEARRAAEQRQIELAAFMAR
jgi:hypothetical protein